LPLYLRYLMNIVFTSLVLLAADWTLYQRMIWWQDLLIATSIIMVAAAVMSSRLPFFMIFVCQFPLSIALMLTFFAWDWQAWLYTYVLAITYYSLLHILLSLFIKYDSLIPAWRVYEAFEKKGSPL